MSQKLKSHQALIFTDGACSGNPGPGGWGAVIAYEGQVRELGGGSRSTTNNRMEMTATLEALKLISESTVKEVWLYTDSTYVIRGITQWIFGWKKRGWKTAEGKDVSNKELWEKLDQIYFQLKQQNIKVDWRYVRGHTGVYGNERVDQIGVSFSKSTRPLLFSGRLEDYEPMYFDLPKDHSLPDQKSKSSKNSNVGAYYLSYVDGTLTTHKTWKECEALVKGRSGAKFKKVKSKPEENEVLKSWGLEPKK